LGIKSDAGRKDNLLNMSERIQAQGLSTSIFDPVLCELAYKWFCTEGGKIYDCFAGGSVRGIVAAKLGYDYHGIDLRQEQINANIANAREIGVCPNWYCDDSLNADKYVADESCDLVFSCPPYADLEVYSDDPRDISNMDYDGFCKVYADIVSIACRKLKQDRFAVFVVGDVRDKKGFYRNFVDYTKKCFNDNGCMTYNEAILVDMLGTAMLRANGTFKSRKLVKVHQNVLVFYKGNPKNIKNNFAEIEIEEALFDD
jgi:16S rRNA G966 N2-methylase RsmD